MPQCDRNRHAIVPIFLLSKLKLSYSRTYYNIKLARTPLVERKTKIPTLCYGSSGSRVLSSLMLPVDPVYRYIVVLSEPASKEQGGAAEHARLCGDNCTALSVELGRVLVCVFPLIYYSNLK